MEEPAIREFFITCFLKFLKSLPASLSYQSLIQGNKPPLLSVHSILRMLPKMPPSISLFIFLWLINSASSNSLYGTKICCQRNTLAKSLCHLMIGSLISRLVSKGHLVLINQATKSVYILIFLFRQLIFVLQSITLSLVSARVGTPSTGSVQIKLGFVPTSDTQNLLEFDEIFTELIKCSRPSLVSAPPVSFRICSSFSTSKCSALVRQKVLVPFVPTSTMRMMMTEAYPLMPVIQMTKESLPMLEKIALPLLNRASMYKSLQNHLNL